MSDYDNGNHDDGDDENTTTRMVQGHPTISPPKKRRKTSGTSKRRNRTWDDYYQLLLQYKEEHEHLRIPRKYETKEGVRLGHWASYQRQNLKPHLNKSDNSSMDDGNVGVVLSTTDKVRQDRINRLNAIEFPFTLRRGPEKGKETEVSQSTSNATPSKSATVKLQSHVEGSRPTPGKDDDSATTTEDEDNDNGLIGNTTSTSKSSGAPLDAAGDPGCGGDQQQEKINHKRQHEATAWEEYFQELVLYKKKNHNLSIPQKYKTATGIELGKWSHNQRKILKPHLDKYKDDDDDDEEGKRTLTAVDKIRKERIRRLNEQEFPWILRTFSKSRPWEEYFQLALSYKEEHQDLRIRHTYKTPGTGINLGEWAQNQRSSYSRQQRGKQTTDQYNISQERIDRLNEIGFPWSLGRGRGKRGRRPAEPKSRSLDHDAQREEEQEVVVDLAASHKDGPASPSHHRSERKELAEQDDAQPAITQQQGVRSSSSMDHVKSSQNQQKSNTRPGPVESLNRQLAPRQPEAVLEPLIESRSTGKDNYSANSKSTMITSTTIGAAADMYQGRFYEHKYSTVLDCERRNGAPINLQGLTLLADVAMAYGLPNDQGHDRA